MNSIEKHLFFIDICDRMSLYSVLLQLHGTYRQKDRIYREDIFYGFGKKLDEANFDEIEKDIAERQSENPLAYTNNKLDFELTDKDLKKLK